MTLKSQKASKPLDAASPLLNVELRQTQSRDLAEIGRLHASAFGPGRFARAAYRVREGAPQISRCCHVACDRREIVAAVNFTKIFIGSEQGALLLGPLAVKPSLTGKGLSAKLVPHTLGVAKSNAIRLVILVGDLPFYSRFGFVSVPPGNIIMPAPVDPARLLAAELEHGALSSFRGLVSAAATTAARASAKS